MYELLCTLPDRSFIAPVVDILPDRTYDGDVVVTLKVLRPTPREFYLSEAQYNALIQGERVEYVDETDVIQLQWRAVPIPEQYRVAVDTLRAQLELDPTNAELQEELDFLTK